MTQVNLGKLIKLATQVMRIRLPYRKQIKKTKANSQPSHR
jgi:3-methyladenine DNA glycosylase AlkC